MKKIYNKPNIDIEDIMINDILIESTDGSLNPYVPDDPDKEITLEHILRL